jgi:hypothetical protein
VSGELPSRLLLVLSASLEKFIVQQERGDENNGAGGRLLTGGEMHGKLSHVNQTHSGRDEDDLDERVLLFYPRCN